MLLTVPSTEPSSFLWTGSPDRPTFNARQVTEFVSDPKLVNPNSSLFSPLTGKVSKIDDGKFWHFLAELPQGFPAKAAKFFHDELPVKLGLALSLRVLYANNGASSSYGSFFLRLDKSSVSFLDQTLDPQAPHSLPCSPALQKN